MKRLSRIFLFHIKILIFYLFFFKLLKLRKLKGKHKTEKVYIVADSAEIRFFDFKLFDDSAMICFNFSWLINDIFNRKQPLYAHMIEPFGFTRISPLSKDTRNYLRTRILSGNLVFLTSLTNFLSLRGKNIYYLFKRIPLDKTTKTIQDRDRNYMLWSGLTAISLAIYMGFSKVQLIGFSTHSESFKEHWYSKNLTKSDENVVTRLKNDYEFNYFLNHFSKFIEIESIVMSNVRESYFRTISYYDLKKTLPVYQENLKMTDKDFLDLMHKDKIYPDETIL